jgi:proteasome lid subunit RPN8/RPN11
MTGNETVTYNVIITITLPGDAGETALRLTLGPADQLPGPNGEQRLLQDCTLADLQQFADALEDEIWRDYLDATLVDLVVDDSLRIKVSYDEGQADLAHSGQLLLDQAVFFPEAGPAAEPEPQVAVQPELVEEQAGDGEAGDEPAPEEAPQVGGAGEQPGDQETAAAKTAAADEEIPVGLLDEQAPAEQPDGEEEEPLVSVAEPEPVHAEREAPVEAIEPVAPSLLPRVRILGRRRPLGHSTPSAVDILINEPAFRNAQAHAISSPQREVAGVLVGPPPEKQPDGRYVVHITDIIIAKHTRMQGASVTYTPESWRYVNDRLAQLYPDDTALIVGWYHTHPGFGIFLSGMDRFIHHNFFTQIWHVALVLDPLARRSGFFSWDRAKTNVDAYDFPWPHWAAGSW